MLSDDDLKRLMLDLLKTQKARDKQTKIGASGIGDPCAYCLANKLIAADSRTGQYWLGAKIGDAIHTLMETEAAKHVNGAQSYHFKALEGADLEKSVYIGTIPGYGDIWSTPDLYITAENHLVDYKTSKRVKVETYRIDINNIPIQYLYQINLYARALIMAGKKVDKMSFVFINRDGTSDRDVVVISLDYNEALAEEAWDRVVQAWNWLEAGGDVETLESDPDCYVCNNILHRF